MLFESAEKHSLQEILNMEMPAVIQWAVPVMLSLVLLEFIIGQFDKKKLYMRKDFFASAAIGVGNLISTAISQTIMFTVVWAVYYYIAPVTIEPAWWSYVLCIICLDFCRYWAHRVAHEQRFWWATHVTHHSSEQYNFAVSFRLSWVQQIKVIFFLPVAAMGFDPIVFFICHQVAVLYQFWLHTELIKKTPKVIEYIFTTPSHHRVHHGRNPKYLDRNYGSTFIIWDRIFGTFTPEEERPDYGITNQPKGFNPVYLVFHEFIDIVNDMKKPKSWKNKIKLAFAPPGTDFDAENQKFIYPTHLHIDDKLQVVTDRAITEPTPFEHDMKNVIEKERSEKEKILV
ncbi:MAG: sterol desaturase family protein [Chitinophagales bacterium]|nr:sterol desaturase family protein [Chitinophagales bacterium]